MRGPRCYLLTAAVLPSLALVIVCRGSALGAQIQAEVIDADTGSPLRRRREEVEYFIRRVQEELDRNRDVLGPESLDEYREAVNVYQSLAEKARQIWAPN